jgi:hypothetical protein
MRRIRVWLWAAGVAALFGAAASLAPAALAAPQHGISFTKGCASPTAVAAPYSCSYTVQNILDEAGDTLTVSGLSDTVHAAGGDVQSGNILGSVSITTTSASSGGTQTGSVCFARVRSGGDLSTTAGSTTVTSPTAAFTGADVGRKLLISGQPYVIAAVTNSTTATLSSAYPNTASGLSWLIAQLNPAQDGSSAGLGPYTNVGYCEIPADARVNVLRSSQYTVQAADFGLPNHLLTDDGSLQWNDECNGLVAGPPPGGGNCNPSPPPVGAASASVITPLTSTTTTAIHDASHAAVTAVAAGATVHDFVTVAGASGSPAPTGNVSIDWFTNNTCTGAPAASSGSVGPLVAGAGSTSTFDATGFARGPLATGQYGFLAHYAGDANTPASNGACEPLSVVDANISITPPTATNEVRTTHTFTAHVNVNTGSGGFVSAPDGTSVTFSLTGPGSFVGGVNTCTTAGGTGACSVQITSATPGVTTLNATTTLSVAGVSLTRATGDANAGDGPNAQKTWVDANVQITPPTATNRVGTDHVLTGHVNVNDGSGAGFVNAPAGTTITFALTGAGAFDGPSTCTTSGTTGSCTVQIKSTATGSSTVTASTTVTVGGVALTRTTGDGLAGDGAPAQKTWVNAKIAIAPSATNAIGQPHTFTVTLSKDTGTGTFVPAPGEHVSVTLTDANGASHTAPTGTCTNAGPNTDANGQCTITFTSGSAGTVTGHASATLAVAGSAPFTVQTDGVAPNSADAVKTFVDANIQINPPSATNPVGTNHVLTLHVNVNPGTGFVNAPDGTTITASLTNSGGATATFVGPSSCTTSGGTGSCTVTISSPTAGTTTIHGTTTVSVGGVSLTRSTGDSNAGDSADATKLWVVTSTCPTGPLGGVQIGGLTNDLFFFGDGRSDANWQSASPGYVGDVTVNGALAKLRTSGSFAYAGTISTNAATLAAWQAIVNNNPGQASAAYNQTALVNSRNAELNAAFTQIDSLPVTMGYANRSSSSLDGINTQNGVNQVIVINVTSGFQISSQINITGDPGDVFILRWDTDANFANGYQGQVKFQSGGAIVPHGGLTPGNFINVAGDINSSGGGKTPAAPYPQGPRLNNGLGALIPGAKDFSGGGFFTGYWLTTGAPTHPADATHVLPYGDTADQSNGIFVGGWYTFTTKFSMTSGTSGVHVCPNPAALR